MTMVIQIGVMILALVVLYHLMIWIVPILIGGGLAWLAIHTGSGWLVGIGAGILGGGLAVAIFRGAVVSGSPAVRLIALLLYAAPPVWAGAITTHAMAIQSGAQGVVWPVIAGIGGAIVFGVLAIARLVQMAPLASETPTPSPSPSPPQPLYAQPFPEPEPKVIYYHPVPPPAIAHRRSDGPFIDV